MATGMEIKTAQKATLFDLLEAKRRADLNKETAYQELLRLIDKITASMEPEDVAYVEKIFENK